MNSTEIKIKNLLSVLSSQLERGTFYKQAETIVSELNTLLSTTMSIIAPTDERYHQVKKLNDILHGLSLMYTNPQTERNSRIAVIKTMLEESIDVIKELSFEVSYDSNGGTPVESEDVAYGTAAQEPDDPTKPDNVFRGWFTDDTTFLHEHNFETLIYDALVLYAKWVTACTVTFNVDSGYAEPAQVIGTGEKVVRPDDEDQVKAGFQFMGWYTDGTFTTEFDFDTVINADTTIYAKYLEEFTVSYQSNGGSEVETEIVLDGGLATKPADPTKTGKTFGGWYTDGTFTTPYNFEDPVTADITLYAKWE